MKRKEFCLKIVTVLKQVCNNPLYSLIAHAGFVCSLQMNYRAVLKLRFALPVDIIVYWFTRSSRSVLMFNKFGGNLMVKVSLRDGEMAYMAGM